jgi:hypothetical protein
MRSWRIPLSWDWARRYHGGRRRSGSPVGRCDGLPGPPAPHFALKARKKQLRAAIVNELRGKAAFHAEKSKAIHLFA